MNVNKIKKGIAYTLVFAYTLIIAGKMVDEGFGLNLPMYHSWLDKSSVRERVHIDPSIETDTLDTSSLEDTVIAPEN